MPSRESRLFTHDPMWVILVALITASGTVGASALGVLGRSSAPALLPGSGWLPPGNNDSIAFDSASTMSLNVEDLFSGNSGDPGELNFTGQVANGVVDTDNNTYIHDAGSQQPTAGQCESDTSSGMTQASTSPQEYYCVKTPRKTYLMYISEIWLGDNRITGYQLTFYPPTRS